MLQGHALRSQIVHQVRREYEEIVEQLEGDLLGHGDVTWSHPYHLCLPQHVYNTEERQGVSQPPQEDRSGTEDEDEDRTSNQDSRISDKDEMEESDEKEHNEQDSEREDNVTESIDHRTNVDKASNHEYTLLEPNLDLSEITIPNDKKELLKLRSQLAMELVWVKQAISSRQQVIHQHTTNSVKCIILVN